MKELIEKYKLHVKKEGLTGEIYKWELLGKYRGRPDTSALDFDAEIRSIDFGNLIYPVGIGAMRHISKEKPEEYRKCYIALFDESVALEKRVDAFNADTLKLYRQLVPNPILSHHHDERTMATCLAYHNPDKYPLYKDSFYRAYCKKRGIAVKSPGKKYLHYIELLNEFIKEFIVTDSELLALVDEQVPKDFYQDKNRLLLAQDIWYQMLDVKEDKAPTSAQTSTADIHTPLNQIFYGPPGTGKTYHSINKALEIIHAHEPIKNIDWSDRNSVKSNFDNLVDAGRIVFTTFHQSMSYEDFIEGIKPEWVRSRSTSEEEEDDSGVLNYEVKPGLFKALCDKARVITPKTTHRVNWSAPKYYKMSLGGKHKPEHHQWCIDNNKIALGWGGSKDLSKYVKLTNWAAYRDAFTVDNPELVAHSRFNTQSTYAFLHMNINDVVVVSKGNHIIDAIGIVKGPYTFSDQEEVDFYHFREVEWIATNLNVAPERFVRKEISQQAIYEFNKNDIKQEAFEQLTPQSTTSQTPAPFVMIVDEINRGNVSQIFGELITLIEEDKRQGKPESLSVTLPYSKQPFSVPPNVYLIGTMNTADRSVEALDTALRRRFSFEEMPPKPELISSQRKIWELWWSYPQLDWSEEPYAAKEKALFDLLGVQLSYDEKEAMWDSMKKEGPNEAQLNAFDSLVENGLSLEVLIKTLNSRIEKLLDRDHQIGHSYFMKVFSIADLKTTFSKNIIPLLQEYFYGDYGKIGMILGEAFFENVKGDANEVTFKTFFDYPADELTDRQVYHLKNIMEMGDDDFITAVKSIL